MQLFELVSPRLFRPLAGPNRAFYAELLLLLWEECRHTCLLYTSPSPRD